MCCLVFWVSGVWCLVFCACSWVNCVWCVVVVVCYMLFRVVVALLFGWMWFCKVWVVLSFIVSCSLFLARCSLLFVPCSLFVARCVLFVMC